MKTTDFFNENANNTEESILLFSSVHISLSIFYLFLIFLFLKITVHMQ